MRRGGSLRRSTNVTVHIDEARQDIHAGQVEDLVTGICLGPFRFFDGDLGEADAGIRQLRQPVLDRGLQRAAGLRSRRASILSPRLQTAQQHSD